MSFCYGPLVVIDLVEIDLMRKRATRRLDVMNELVGYVKEHEEEFVSFLLAAIDSVAPTSSTALIARFLKQETSNLKLNGFEELASELDRLRIKLGKQLIHSYFGGE